MSELTEKELREQNALLKKEIFRAEQLKTALLSQCVGFFNANLTKDLIDGDFITLSKAKNYTFSLDDVGMSAPCKLSTFFKNWKEKMVPKEHKEDLENVINFRETLIENFEIGVREFPLSFWTNDIHNNQFYISLTCLLTKDEETNDILLFATMKDRTEEKYQESLINQYESTIRSELEKNLKNAQVIQALSNDFESVYYVDFETDTFTSYRLSEPITKEYGKFLESNPPFTEALKTYISKTVSEDDKEEMSRITTKESLKEIFKEKNVFEFDYRGIRNSKQIFCRMKIVNLSQNGEFKTFLFGFSDISDFKGKEIERYTFIDTLTGGDNYIRFKEKVKNADKKGYIVAFDISSFKIINSICGPARGDEVLKYVWLNLQTFIYNEDFCAHIYGDSFVLFLTDRKKEKVISLLGLLTHSLIALSIDMDTPQIVPYFGVAKWTPKSNIEETYSHAIVAKNKIKVRKDINYAFFRKEDTKTMILEKKLADNFETAIQTGKFELWLQPKFNPNSHRFTGAEALIRWRQDEDRLLSPSQFIPLFERNGLIRVLDEYVFRKVCLLQKKWADEGRKIIPISINISRASLYFKTVPEQYKWIAESIGVEKKFIPLEITESAAVGNTEIKRLADKFHKAGFKLHMDDFGSGYSSLSSLNTMHFDTLKIDKSLVDFIGNDNGDKLLRHSIELAKELGMQVTAEGVENEEQVNFLKSLNCDCIQGYFYSKPLSVEDFEEKLFGKIENRKIKA